MNKRDGEDRGHTFCQPCHSTGGLAQHTCARGADDDSLRVREDGGNGEAACGKRGKHEWVRSSEM